MFGISLALFLLATPADTIVLDPPVVAAPEVVATVDRVFVESDVSAHQVRTLDMVKQEISESDQLRPFQKRRLLRRLNRPWIAERVTDEITMRSMSAGLVVVDLDEGTGDAVTTVDWDGIADFIERLLPLIIQIIGLF